MSAFLLVPDLGLPSFNEELTLHLKVGWSLHYLSQFWQYATICMSFCWPTFSMTTIVLFLKTSAKPKYRMQSAGFSSRPWTQECRRVSTGMPPEGGGTQSRGRQCHTCPAALLVVVLHGLADGMVNDEPDVSLIYAHPKRHGRHHHLVGHPPQQNVFT